MQILEANVWEINNKEKDLTVEIVSGRDIESKKQI